jgi:hypothetical protein
MLTTVTPHIIATLHTIAGLAPWEGERKLNLRQRADHNVAVR